MGSYKVLYDYPNYASLPSVGDVSRLYITNDTNTLYRWVDGAYHFFTTTSVPWGNINGVLTNQTDLMAVLNGKQPLITAGTTAQYYRGDKTFQTLNSTAVPEGTNLYWTDARFNTGFSGKSTTNLTEGSNLYYTDARFDTRFGTKSTTNLTEGSNLYWTNARFDTRLGLKTTSDLSEGSNLYYTDARFDTRFGTKTTDNLTEGSTKLYYSSSRFNADFNNKNTDNLPEGSTNLFWTPARSRNALTLLTVGTGGLSTYNSTTGQLNIPQYQDLLVNPLVGAGSQYYVPRYSGTTSLTPGLIYDNGVYIGINRTNPFYTLDVNGTLNVEGVSIYRNLAGTGDRLVYVSANGTLTPAIIGSGLSIVSGTLSATGTASGSIGGSGTIGYVPKFSGTAAITNSNIRDDGTVITLGSFTNISSGSLGIGTAALNGYTLNALKNITGGVISYGISQAGVSQTDVTVSAYGFVNISATVASAYTLSQYFHYSANQGTIGSGSAITTQIGFDVANTLIGATNNFGYRGRIPSGTNRWNIYMDGTADNYLAGSLGIGTTTLTAYTVNVGKNITGGTTAYGVRSQGTVQSDVTTLVSNYGSLMNTAAASFTLTDFVHHRSMQGTIGSGSVVTNQYGYFADSSMIGATNNFGFYGNIPSGTNRWNLYMNGTANNYMAGSLGIGSTSLTGYNLRVGKNITGNVFSFGINQSGIVQSDVTSAGWGFQNQLYTAAASFTLSNYYHFFAEQQTIGAGSTVNNQYGFFVSSSLIGAATNNYGFRSEIPSGTNRWNLYMGGTAQNYLAGALSIGITTANASALLQVDSTTQGVLFPRMTTTQKNAISSPSTGLVVFDTTLGKLSVFSTTWQTITSV
jgi:hypothetical protein